MLSGRAPAEQTTGRLFDDETLERFRRVMPVVDMLNKKYGRDTVRLARANPKGRWKTRAAKRSPRYTTKPAEVPLISDDARCRETGVTTLSLLTVITPVDYEAS